MAGRFVNPLPQTCVDPQLNRFPSMTMRLSLTSQTTEIA
jgi:hypothetical protein